jgi:putative flippase GtrA
MRVRPTFIPRREVGRYAVAGAATALVYFGVTLILATVGTPIQIAIVVGWLCSLCAHFSLQRFFVFRRAAGFELQLHRQLARYLGTATVQYALTATATAVLPEALHVDARLVYVITALVAALVVFTILRLKVFHPPA